MGLYSLLNCRGKCERVSVCVPLQLGEVTLWRRSSISGVCSGVLHVNEGGIVSAHALRSVSIKTSLNYVASQRIWSGSSYHVQHENPISIKSMLHVRMTPTYYSEFWCHALVPHSGLNGPLASGINCKVDSG